MFLRYDIIILASTIPSHFTTLQVRTMGGYYSLAHCHNPDIITISHYITLLYYTQHNKIIRCCNNIIIFGLSQKCGGIVATNFL